MVSYPQLIAQQQAKLPVLIKPALPIPSQFDDSTHKLWRCETEQGSLILKVCDHDNVQKSAFWQGMNSLFDADFPRSLRNIATTYNKIAEEGILTVPRFIAAEGDSHVLAEWLEGDAIVAEDVTDFMVIQLAQHLGKLHSQIQSNWGPMHQAKLDAEQWSSRLYKTIQNLADNSSATIPNNVMTLCLHQAEAIKVEQFVPIMVDLRWDQFLQKNKQLTALVDLDAFVYGPKGLELVLLEYLLNAEQAALFKQHYQHNIELVDLNPIRKTYRLLLFLMNVLGETDLDAWFSRSAVL